MKDLPLLDGAPKRPNENLTPAQIREMEEINKMTQDADAGFAVMAQEMAAGAAASEGAEALLMDVKAILVNVCLHFSIPLPAPIKDAITAGEYDPNDYDVDEDDEGEDAEFTEPKA